jgi:hypothetical protein
MKSSKKIGDILKESNGTYDFTPSIKKAFKILQTKTSTKYLLEKDNQLFKQKDVNNRYITIISGIDIRFGYKFITNSKDRDIFWQYIYLMSIAVFRLIELANPSKIEKYPNVLETTIELEKCLSDTGIYFRNSIFNPFVGMNGKNENYTVDDLFANVDKLKSGGAVGMETIMSTIGLDKILDDDKINKFIDDIGEDKIEQVAESVSNILGTEDDKESKEVYATLVNSLFKGIKKDGVKNIDKTFSDILDNVNDTIGEEKMRKTAENVTNFMDNGEEKLKSMKDKDGNPISDDMVNKLNKPMKILSKMKNPKELMKDPSKLFSSIKDVLSTLETVKK